MKGNMKWTVLAVAVVAATAAGNAAAVDVDIHTHIDTHIDNKLHNETKNKVENEFSTEVKSKYYGSYKARTDIETDIDTDINYDSDTDIDKEVDEHGVSAELESDLSLTSDIDFSGDPTVSGDLPIDSASLAVVDNRQKNSGNVGWNDVLTNDASISENTATAAEGNLGFNVAAGDNNQQDNAAALSAVDAAFAFGLADSKVFVQQFGKDNLTKNIGNTNTASVGDMAFADASGNIGVNVTAGNNNQQKNALAASVATSRYASAAVSSNQQSRDNFTVNAPKRDVQYDRIGIELRGRVSGGTVAVGGGSYSGSESGTYAGTGNSYQSDNFYLDTWSGALPHSNGNVTGHIDMDAAIQNAVANPDKPGVGGIGFDNTESGTYAGEESGELGFLELGYADLWASLSGYVTIARDVVDTYTTNTASLSGDAFARASGNIGVNVSAGTGNQQANSLAMAVAQPSAGGGGETPPPPTGE